MDYITRVFVNEFGYSAEQAEAPAELLFSMTHTPNPQDVRDAIGGHQRAKKELAMAYAHAIIRDEVISRISRKY